MTKDKDPNLPPFFRNWGQMYAAVAASLLFVVLFLYWFSRLYL